MAPGLARRDALYARRDSPVTMRVARLRPRITVIIRNINHAQEVAYVQEVHCDESKGADLEPDGPAGTNRTSRANPGATIGT